MRVLCTYFVNFYVHRHKSLVLCTVEKKTRCIHKMFSCIIFIIIACIAGLFSLAISFSCGYKTNSINIIVAIAHDH